MNLRLCLRGTFIAALPVAVELPANPDSAGPRRGETRLEALAGTSEYGIVTRGCNGEVLSEIKERVDGGTLGIEHRFPDDWVVGVRGGSVRMHTQSVSGLPEGAGGPAVNRGYVNPWVAYEARDGGIGVGWLHADGPFPLNHNGTIDPGISAHVRIGPPKLGVALRFMEDPPLLVNPYLQLDFELHPQRNVELAFGPGMLGPFDGAMLGLKGRVWITPDAAVDLRAGFGSRGQHWVAAGATARLRDPRGRP